MLACAARNKIGGILGYSGAMIAPGAPRSRKSPRTWPPVRLVHGDADPVVPVQALDDIERALTAANAVPFDGLRHSRPSARDRRQRAAQLGADFLQDKLLA